VAGRLGWGGSGEGDEEGSGVGEDVCFIFDQLRLSKITR